MSVLNTPTCCHTVYRDHPSRVRKYHAKSCPLHPGEEIVSVRRAETASHASRGVDDRGDGAYIDYWADRAFEQEGGR